ncbi:MAG: 6-pyruvoyl-tetrahydropterin synthase-related protein [Acidimicrobiales bacterium]|nr:6-pyruvoyl-tetrahydropterin synthase-related protein [Acidimicrobiales bacterium]
MTDALAEVDLTVTDAGGGPGPGYPSPRERQGRLSRAWSRLLHVPAEGFLTFFVVSFCVGFVFVQVAHPFQNLDNYGWTGFGTVFADTTPAGGDMGAHVWGPAYLRDHLLPQGRLSGWTKDWYAGFPAYQFYMVVPSLLIALGSYVIPYGVAFKLVTILGLLTLPVALYLFGRFVGLPFPSPALLAVAGTVFLFDRSFSIYGGNIPSTLAGEFAFSISLTFAWLYLAFLARGLRTGKGWAATAVFAALTALCHPIPLIFAMVATAALLLVFPGVAWRTYLRIAIPAGLVAIVGVVLGVTVDSKAFLLSGAALVVMVIVTPGVARGKYWLAAGLTGALLSAFWTVPFYLQHKYMNDMGWEKRTDWWNMLYERTKGDGTQMVDQPSLRWTLAVAAAGLLLSIIWVHRGGIFLAITAAAMALMFIHLPEARLWNARLLPFYYLCVYLLAAVGIAEVGRLLSMLFARDIERPIRALTAITALGALGFGMFIVAMPLRVVPGGYVDRATGEYRWLWWSTTDSSYIDSWANWNYTGYESKPAYPEYYAIVQTMARLGEERGCGRAMWEHEEQHDRYGTPMALMLLPFWTDGCIGSMEGLYFEASSTTPFHFINQDELSTAPSNAQRDLPYGPGPNTLDQFNLGIDHLKMLGVRYYMVISEHTKGFAAEHPDLELVATSGPWDVYQIASGNELVVPLPYQPAVVTDLAAQPIPREPNGHPKTGNPWQFMAVPWYMDRNAWDVYLTDSGPQGWQRVKVGESPGLIPNPPVEVTNIVETEDSITFDVSRPGVPVLIKSSYFPNWQVAGGEGPWRATPNLMIVVPTSTHVELRYGYTAIDYLSWLLTLAGVAALVLLVRARPLAMPQPWRFGRPAPAEPEPAADPGGSPLTADGLGSALPDDKPAP